MRHRRLVALVTLCVALGCAEDGSLIENCGDGFETALEECDDGNVMDGDGCSADCEIEIGNEAEEPPENQATLAWIQANVFTPICTECHVPAGPGPFELTSEAVSHANLVNVMSIEVALFRVAPGDPENSYIVHKIEGRPTILGTRMPPPPRPALSDEQRAAIIGWIAAGAPP